MYFLAVPIEVKSGKDYTVHSALNTFVSNEDYHIKKAFVLSNERTVTSDGKTNYINQCQNRNNPLKKRISPLSKGWFDKLKFILQSFFL